MTLEKATKDMQALVAQHGFNYEGELTYDGRQIFTRRWTKKTQVVWYGECESTLEIKISMSYGIPLVPKRAFNAIGEIVRCAGFEM